MLERGDAPLLPGGDRPCLPGVLVLGDHVEAAADVLERLVGEREPIDAQQVVASGGEVA
jgi:hypothetical protein